MPAPNYTELSLSDYLLNVSPTILAHQIKTQDQEFFQCLLKTFCSVSSVEAQSILSVLSIRLLSLIKSQQISSEIVQNIFINTICLESKLSLLQYVIIYTSNNTDKLSQLMVFLNVLASYNLLSPYSVFLMIAKPNCVGVNAYHYSLMIGSDQSQLLYAQLLNLWQKGILSTQEFSTILLSGTKWVLQFQLDKNISQHFVNLNVLIQNKQIDFIALKDVLTSSYKSVVDFATYPHRTDYTVYLYMRFLRQCVKNGAWALADYHQFIENPNLPSDRIIHKSFFEAFPSFTSELKLCLEERNLQKIEKAKEAERNLLINKLPGLGMLINNLSLFNTRSNSHKEFSYFSSARITEGIKIPNNHKVF